MTEVVIAVAPGHEAEFQYDSVRQFLSQFADIAIVSAAIPHMATARVSQRRLEELLAIGDGVLTIRKARGVQLL